MTRVASCAGARGSAVKSASASSPNENTRFEAASKASYFAAPLFSALEFLSTSPSWVMDQAGNAFEKIAEEVGPIASAALGMWRLLPTSLKVAALIYSCRSAWKLWRGEKQSPSNAPPVVVKVYVNRKGFSQRDFEKLSRTLLLKLKKELAPANK